MKIVFFGTSNVALPILEALLKEHEILGVVTQPDAKVGRKQILQESPVSALANDLKLNLLKPEKIKNNPDFLNTLTCLNADIFVVVSYGKILPLNIINLPTFKTINVHFSMLPKYRGPSPMQQALLNGDKTTGISIFILDELVDHGPLLYQKEVNIEVEDNIFTLSDKLAKTSASAMNNVLLDYTTSKIKPDFQDENNSSLTKIITKQDGQINWQKNAEEIFNEFRAFFLWPNIWTKWNEKLLKITDCEIHKSNLRNFSNITNNLQTGQVLSDGIVVCGNNTFLQIKSLQLEGKNETTIKNFLNGYPNFVGSVLKSDSL